VLEKIKKTFLNFLFPIDCVGCGKEDFWLCPDCLSVLPLGHKEECLFCGQESTLGKTCPACASSHHLDGVFICSNYKNKIIAELIKKLKYSFASELGEILGQITVLFFKKIITEEKYKTSNLTAWQVLPIPLHKKRFNWRGFNQAKIIAEYFSSHCNQKILNGLVRLKYQTPQAKLSGAERPKNIEDCFAWTGENLNKKNILLIDDVATTGSTLNEAAKVLKQAGAEKVWGLVIAKG
jgi:ComF family protein